MTWTPRSCEVSLSRREWCILFLWKKENIKNLKITIVDSLGNDLINVNNLYSWNNSNKPMQFSLNYQIDEKGNKLAEENPKARWFFPYAKDNYLLSIANTFPADNFRLKVVSHLN